MYRSHCNHRHCHGFEDFLILGLLELEGVNIGAYAYVAYRLHVHATCILKKEVKFSELT